VACRRGVRSTPAFHSVAFHTYMDPTYQLNWYIAYSTSAPPSSKLLEAGRVATAVDEIHP